MQGSSQPATTTQIQKTELPAWVDAASQQNYAQAQATSANLSPSAPQNVAGQTALQGQAVDMLNQSAATSGGLFGQAASMFGAAGGTPATTQIQGPNPVLFNNTGYHTVDPQKVGYQQSEAANAGGYNAVGAAAGVKDVAAKGFLDRDVNAYMNPYTQQVIDATDTASRRDESLSLMKNADANRASGSWGGSRDAITNAVIQSEGLMNRAQTGAGLRSAAFTNAQGQINTDNASELQAGMANQNSALNTQTLNQNTFLQNALQDLQARQYNATNLQSNNQFNTSLRSNTDQFNSSQNLAGQQFNATNMTNVDQYNGNMNLQKDMFNTGQYMDTQKFNAGAKNTASLTGSQNALAAAQGIAGIGSSAGQLGNAQSLLAANLGQAQQANQQAFLDAQTANAGLGNQDATNALNMRLAALGMSPYGKTTTSNSTSQGGTSSNTGMQVLGGAMSILPMLFSDRNVKKDIKRLGKVPGTDLNKYEFRYKKGFMGNDMGDEKQIGLMAQDVEKKVPGAVHKVNVGGKKVRAVDYGKALSHGFMGN